LSTDLENKKISVFTFFVPFGICFLMCVFHFFNLDSRNIFAIVPLNWDYITGIFLAPFAHSTSSHLINNALPLFFLMSILIHFFDRFSYTLIFLMYFFTGFFMWMFCPPYHNIIGASGIVYCMASFLFFSGVFKKNRQLMSFSLIIIFLYGGMFWGIFDLPHNSKMNISWESHRIGFLLGILLAFLFKSKGPQKKIYDWEDEELLEEEEYKYIIKD